MRVDPATREDRRPGSESSRWFAWGKERRRLIRCRELVEPIRCRNPRKRVTRGLTQAVRPLTNNRLPWSPPLPPPPRVCAPRAACAATGSCSTRSSFSQAIPPERFPRWASKRSAKKARSFFASLAPPTTGAIARSTSGVRSAAGFSTAARFSASRQARPQKSGPWKKLAKPADSPAASTRSSAGSPRPTRTARSPSAAQTP